MILLRVDSSIRAGGSVSRALADTVTGAWRAEHPDGTVRHRDVFADPVPITAWSAALAGRELPIDQRTPEQAGAVDLATAIADELATADAAVIAAPLYNFGISLHLKAWIDMLITDPRFRPGKSPLAGKSVALAVARGGGYGPGTPREGWDHATPWLVRIFRDVFGADVTEVTAELTMAEVNPAMADLIPLSHQSAAAAHDLAASTGKAFATR
ncbi:FMN-dependent NADH-azoreductase [Actinokineospora inagensis]|uniref:FMN-dependent NADH-azoreductase n=1 Tax=Actinokineospora inagensis TaxID=103730 RepID=UPI000416A368|nr:NAD(P)H-dependent oxidoreductase [Actinokineospora inagensis]